LDVSIPETSPITSDFAASSNTDKDKDKTEKPEGKMDVTTRSNEPGQSSQESSSEAAVPKPDKTEVASPVPEAEALATPISAEAGPVLVITLLLTSGARHPYKIDEKYLTKRHVTVPEMTENGRKDPFSISVYTLKELILREWREEWEVAPSSPSSIRLIYFGRLLDDKTALKECRFNTEAANVVHMTVRPQDLVDEEEAQKNKASSRHGEGGESTAGCRCVIM